MQLIALGLRSGTLDLRHVGREIGKVFAGWNSGDLDSYLIEITATVLAKRDPSSKAAPVDMIRDEAEMSA
jgi:6-phosphogluconate dehydrogenase